jgi:hypothetical protein
MALRKVPILNIPLLTYHCKAARWVDSIEILEYREVAKIAEDDGIFSIFECESLRNAIMVLS